MLFLCYFLYCTCLRPYGSTQHLYSLWVTIFFHLFLWLLVCMGKHLNWRSPTKGFQSFIHYPQMSIFLRERKKTSGVTYRIIHVLHNYGHIFSGEVSIILASFKDNKAVAPNEHFSDYIFSCISDLRNKSS